MNFIIYYSVIISILGGFSTLFFLASIRLPHLASALEISKSLRIFTFGLILIPLLFYFFPVKKVEFVSSKKAIQDQIYTSSVIEKNNEVQTVKITPKTDEYKLKIIFLLLTLFTIWQVLIFFKESLTLNKIIKNTITLKKFKNVEIRISDEGMIPFAFWFPKKYIVVLPAFLLENKKLFYSAVSHELTHHRHGDTKWAYVMTLLKIIFSWNPFFYLYQNYLNHIQELACDAFLLGQKKSSFQDYASCLLKVAEQSVNAHFSPVGTTGMSMGQPGKQLKQRIMMMKWYRLNGIKQKTIFLPLFIFTLLIGFAFASHGLVSVNQITRVESEELVKNARKGTDFPIEVNDKILEQLNFYIGTPHGKRIIKDALKRKAFYQKIFDKKFKKYHSPEELLAIALMESGFKNLPANENPMKSAGIWQFIPETAKDYGLKYIGEENDERLNVEAETDAALRLLNGLNLRFRDWRLAIMAYNAGGGRVQKFIDETGSRDPWHLIDQGFPGDPNYLAKVMAGVLILKNPSLLK